MKVVEGGGWIAQLKRDGEIRSVSVELSLPQDDAAEPTPQKLAGARVGVTLTPGESSHPLVCMAGFVTECTIDFAGPCRTQALRIVSIGRAAGWPEQKCFLTGRACCVFVPEACEHGLTPARPLNKGGAGRLMSAWRAATMLTEIERIALRRRLAEWAKDSMPSYTIIGNDAYERPVLFSTAREWLPDESLDDCRPLLAEIGRRELWPRFVVALRKVAPKPFYMRRTRYFLHLTPAQITAAVTKLMEENP